MKESTNKQKARVSIVGAGPGDKDLITVKGLKAIESADVILYDALANKELLEHTTEDTRLVYVGKRAGKHAYSQDGINELCRSCAVKYGHVVRLKGGDPFIFGRGHEELEYLRKHGILTEVVPGISSSTALPLLQEVPLTRRGIAESFWVITATTSYGKLSKDISIAAQSSTTLVILMGIKKLPEIVKILHNSGKAKTPIMIVQNGSRRNEKVVIGNAQDIIEKSEREKIGTPGIIIVGEVVSLHPSLILEKAEKLWVA